MINEIGEPAMLEMLAEELVECAHEALKLARVKRGENPTPRTEKELNLDVDWNQIEMKKRRFEERWNNMR